MPIEVGGVIVAIRYLRYNDEVILRKKCKEVKIIDGRILTILDDMLETLHYLEHGAALAANQIGILKRLVVIDYCGYCYKLVNPQIIGYSGIQECIEGCLSFPNCFVKTIRPKKVTIQALDEKGNRIILIGDGELAKCFCHELEHLEGEIYLDKAIEKVYL